MRFLSVAFRDVKLENDQSGVLTRRYRRATSTDDAGKPLCTPGVRSQEATTL